MPSRQYHQPTTNILSKNQPIRLPANSLHDQELANPTICDQPALQLPSSCPPGPDDPIIHDETAKCNSSICPTDCLENCPRFCDACPHCTDKCNKPKCNKCRIKLQNLPVRSNFPSTNLPTWSICEVKRHSSEKSLWICANNKVYDATPIIKWHPGGMKTLGKRTGFDCTRDFNFHSTTAKTQVWKPLHIGNVTPCYKGTPTYLPPKPPSCSIL